MGESHSGRVLFADDDEPFRRALTRLMTQAGFDVVSVPDGMEADRALHNDIFDVFVADVNMPGNTDLRLLGQASNVSVLVITGDPQLESAVLALRGAAVDYLAKPLDPVRFMSRLSEGVRRTQTLRRVRETKTELEGKLAFVNGLLDSLESGALPCVPSAPVIALDIEQRLTERELEVLRVFRATTDFSKIAERLHISRHTVKNHLRSIYRKLGVHSKASLVQVLETGALPSHERRTG